MLKGLLSKKLNIKELKKNPKLVDILLDFFVLMVFTFFGFVFTKQQKKWSKEILKRIFLRKRHTIAIAACRQIGKTETICFLIWFLSYIFPIIEGESFKAVILAPDQSTGTEVYDRTKALFDDCENRFPEQFKFKEKNNAKIVCANGSSIAAWGLFKAFSTRERKKSTKEGRTFHMSVRDEMHLGDDAIFNDDIEPALSTTGGVDIWLGNGGYRNCKAKKIIDNGNTKDSTVFALSYDFMKKEQMREYKRTKNPIFKRWIDSQEKYISDNGIMSDLVRKNLFLKWIVEVGNFITEEALKRLCRDKDPEEWPTKYVDGGLDFGKSSDESVVTLTDYQRNIRTWGVFYGEYPDQVEQFAEWIKEREKELDIKLRRLYCDSTGVGDPVTAMLKRKLRCRVRGVKFTAASKDVLAKKAIAAMSNEVSKSESIVFSDRLTYPKEHKLRVKFEFQMTELEKEIRGSTELLNYHHPDKPDAKDDFADSLFLSLYGIEKIKKIRTFNKRANL